MDTDKLRTYTVQRLQERNKLSMNIFLTKKMLKDRANVSA